VRSTRSPYPGSNVNTRWTGGFSIHVDPWCARWQEQSIGEFKSEDLRVPRLSANSSLKASSLAPRVGAPAGRTFPVRSGAERALPAQCDQERGAPPTVDALMRVLLVQAAVDGAQQREAGATAARAVKRAGAVARCGRRRAVARRAVAWRRRQRRGSGRSGRRRGGETRRGRAESPQRASGWRCGFRERREIGARRGDRGLHNPRRRLA
jgi:hypothetical protein